MAKTAKAFATRLHVYTHMTVANMEELCKKAGILTPVLRQALQASYNKCLSCKTNGRPLATRKISFNKFLRTFNENVHVDFFWIKDLTSLPILHVKDSSTGYITAVIASSKDQEVAAKLFAVYWININGPPQSVAADFEFDNEPMRAIFRSHNIQFNGRPARRHSKTGSVEGGNGTLQFFAQRLIKDAEHLKAQKGINFSADELLSKAVFLTNFLYGEKSLSASELAHGYTLSVAGLPQQEVSAYIVVAHQEKVVRRSLHDIFTSRSPRVLSRQLIQPRTPIYFFEKRTKFGVWKRAFVVSAEQHLVQARRTKSNRGRVLKIAYEDVRLAPRSSLLFELDRIEFDDDMRKVLGSSPELPESSEFSEEISDDKPISSDTPLPAHEPSLYIYSIASYVHFTESRLPHSEPTIQDSISVFHHSTRKRRIWARLH